MAVKEIDLVKVLNDNGIIDYYDYNNNGKYDQSIIDGKLYYEDYDNPKTSGLGKFILNSNSLNYNFETFDERCEGFIVDNAPHNAEYFADQLLAVKNYYNTVFLISHLDGLKDCVDMQIVIEKKKNIPMTRGPIPTLNESQYKSL